MGERIGVNPVGPGAGERHNSLSSSVPEQRTVAKVGAVLVVGGGVAGVQASLDLAELGFKVYLVESKMSIGGVMAQLDKTFPTNDCSMCILAPKLVGAGRHPNIELMTGCELLGISGSPGDFRARVLRRPRYIRPELCTGCGTCAQKCPSKVPNEFDLGLSKRRAAYVLFPQAVPLKYAIDSEHCIYFKTGKCGNCRKSCPAGAVDFEMRPEELELSVGAIIVSTGFSPHAPSKDGPYGHGRFSNVVTSMEFERILSASGPYGGHVRRPSDGREPARVAFIQCVGSRDARTNPWCSSVCCMYATKEAIIAREHCPGLRSTIFFMDLRAFGKEFEYYYKRAQAEYGVTYVRSRAPEVSELPDGSLRVRYETDSGELRSEDFDLVVLSVGLCPPEGLSELAQRLGVELNRDGFVSTGPFSPMDTSAPGVYVCGAAQGPKDIPDTVAQASGAAALAARGIASERGALVARKEYPPETDFTGQRPRVGVFVCHCGINIGGVVDVPEVAAYARTLPGVVYAEDNLYSCSQDAQKRIREKILEHRLNRVVVASCTPRTHEPLFQDTCREAGLNPYLFEMANIRDQCSWVHMHEPERATAKAKRLVRAAVSKARTLQPLSRQRTEVKCSGLVIGGGVSGVTAALELASHGVPVTLVERERELGGLARRLHKTIEGEDARERIRALEERLRSSGLARVLTGASVKKIEGYVGRYKVTVETSGEGPGSPGETVVDCGAIIVATGAREYRPEEHLYGGDPRVLTQLELEERLGRGEIRDIRSAVFIQCVGSRSERRGYCSRVCCSASVKNALALKRMVPGAAVYVLYRDMRTYGLREEWYQRAREEGVEFIRHEDDEPPVVEIEGGALKVTVREPLLDKRVVLRPDVVVLASALLPPEGAPELAKTLKVPLSRDGFFLEAHMKLRPVEFATSGVFLCGSCSSPKFIDECVSQAEAAAAKALVVLQSGHIEAEPYVSEIRED